MNDTISDTIRGEVCAIVSEMLDNPDEYGIYPTTVAYDKLVALVMKHSGGDKISVSRDHLERLRNYFLNAQDEAAGFRCFKQGQDEIDSLFQREEKPAEKCCVYRPDYSVDNWETGCGTKVEFCKAICHNCGKPVRTAKQGEGND